MLLLANSIFYIFVPEVDWCSTNINHPDENRESKSLEKKPVLNPWKTKIRYQSTSFFLFQYL